MNSYEVWRHIRAVLLLPVMVVVVIPGLVTYLTGRVNVGWTLPPPWGLAPALLGVLLMGLGLALVIATNVLVIRIGEGTLAPWDPTRRLVVQGVYRHVRNLMISGVFCILLGEALVLGSRPLFAWFLLFLVLNLVYIPLFEEESLERRFGPQFLEYKRHVPRWVPRLRPWRGLSADEGEGRSGFIDRTPSGP